MSPLSAYSLLVIAIFTIHTTWAIVDLNTKVAEECSKEQGCTADQVKQKISKGEELEHNEKCFIDCVMTKSGLILDGAMPKDIPMAINDTQLYSGMYESCNDKVVSANAEQCDKGMTLIKCFWDMMEKMGKS